MSEFDFLIKNTTIVEGSGRSAYKGSIGISGERIVDLGSVKGDAKVTLDAKGMSTLPGFIDAHSHGDQTILWYPHCESLVMQGVTTFIGGNCGHSMAPLEKYIELPYLLSDLLVDLEPFMYYRPPLFPYNKVNEWMEECYGWSITWRTMEEYLNVVEDKGLSMNYVPLVGHGAIRYVVMGLDYKRHSTKEEQSEMREHIHEAMEAGCFGMSTGLDYDPDVFASSEEVVDGVSVLKEYDGVYSPHWRRTGRRKGVAVGHLVNERINGLMECVDVYKKTGVKLHFAHLSAGWEIFPVPPPEDLEAANIKATIDTITKDSKSELDITWNAVPHLVKGSYSVTSYLCSLLAPWLRILKGRDNLGRWLRAKDFRDDIKNSIRSGKWFIRPAYNPNTNPRWAENIYVSKSEVLDLDGKSIAEIAKERNVEAWDAWFDIIAEDPHTRAHAPMRVTGPQGTMECFHLYLTYHPSSMMGTDTRVLDDKFKGVNPPYQLPGINVYSAYPLFYIKYVRESDTFSLEEAVQKTSVMPSRVFNLEDRGTIKKGGYADLVLMDLQNLRVLSDEIEARRYPRGIDYVFINGTPVVEKGKHTRAKPGKVIRRGA
jgi:N-acyl-D-aspartate/D-glutamate deacylase